MSNVWLVPLLILPSQLRTCNYGLHTITDYGNYRYSAEVAGTIIVQCIPILRPFLRDMHTSLTSKKLDDTEIGQSVTRRSRASTLEAKHGSPYIIGDDDGKKGTDVIALTVITEETGKELYSSDSTSDIYQQSTPTIPSGPLTRSSWRFSGSERADIHSSLSWVDLEEYEETGLRPPPPRPARN